MDNNSHFSVAARRAARVLAAALGFAALAGCGQKGPLRLPDAAAPAATAPAASAASTGAAR